MLDGFPRNLVQAEALDEMLAEIGRPLDCVLFFDLDDETATRRLLGRAARREPPRRRARGDRAPARDLPRADRAGGRALPGRRDPPPARRGSKVDDVFAEIESALVHDHPQGPGRDRAHRARGRPRRGDDRPRRRAPRAPESRRASSTTSQARSSPSTAARRRRRATAAPQYPAEICISPNAMVVHGIPGPYRVADGDLVTIDVGAVLDGAIADSAYTFGVGTIDPEAQRLLDSPRTPSRPASPRRAPATGSATSPSRSSPSSREPASRSSAASSGTASAGTTTRTRTCRTSASRAAGRSSPRG